MPADSHPSSDLIPFVLIRRLLNPETVGWMRELATAAYGRLDDLRPANAPFTAEIEVPPRGRFVVTASSFSLELRFFAWDRLPQRLQGDHFIPLKQ